MARTIPILATTVLMSICLAALLLLPVPAHAINRRQPPLPDASALAKLDPEALRIAKERGSVDVIIRGRAEPHLAALGQIADPARRRQAVVAALQDTAQSSQRSLVQALTTWQSHGYVRSVRPFWIFNGIAATVDRDRLLALAARPDVVSIRLDRIHRIKIGQVSSVQADSFEWQVDRVGASQVWSGFGVDGSGVVVGIIDTGVDWQHPALLPHYRGYRGKDPAQHLGNWVSTTGETIAYPYDAFGHGTEVTGLIVGSDGARYTGIAPGAKWIAAKAFNDRGEARDSWIHAAFQWMLAPNGDPSLAPDIVNNSWSTDSSLSAEFRDDVRSLLAAGILPIFAAGNGGPEAGTIAAPASYPEALAIGAVDRADVAANFSARGPSPYDVSKPDAVAPGVDVVTTGTGGRYLLFKGTSAAAPIAAGVGALVIQARPSITPVETTRVLTSTAVPLGSTLPNNTYGWGRLDAYTAVAAVANAGRVIGAVLDGAGAPIPGAMVLAVDENSGDRLATRADATGHYSFALGPAAWQLTASAFGYYDAAPVRIVVRAGSTYGHTFQLALQPTDVVTGRVADRWIGTPVTATITVSGILAGQVPATTTDAWGRYRLPLPVGQYTLLATAEGYRRAHKTVTITAGTPAVADFDLDAAPRILLIDGGVWYDESTAPYWGTALDSLDYLYVTRPITSPTIPVTTTELTGFDLVIWSSPHDSPGFSQSDGALIDYVRSGGRVLLSGEDIAYWDDGPGAATFSGYLRQYFHTSFVDEETDAFTVRGALGGIFQGLTLTLNTVDSAGNQQSPDVLAPTDDFAIGVLRSDQEATLATRSASCTPARMLVLGFGLEGSGPTADRHAFLERAIDWLAGPGTTEYVAALPTEFRGALPGSRVDTTIRLRNTGPAPKLFEITLTGGTWPKALLGPGARPLSSPLPLNPCEAITATIAITVPLDTQRAVADVGQIGVQPLGAPDLRQTLAVTTFTPAPLLLVDHDFVYPSEAAYTTTLNRLNAPFDRWDTVVYGSPTAEVLGMYRDVVWFTGYDWHAPVSAGEEQALTRYLDDGGRLLLSSQDYLALRGSSPFVTSHLGVLTYTQDVTAGVVAGVVGNPVGDGIVSSQITLPFSDWSDAVTPTITATVAFRDRLNRPVGITFADASRQSKTAFLAFPLEGLPDAARDRALSNAIRWFDPLGASILAVSPARARSGDDLEYVLTLADLTGASRMLGVDIPPVADIELLDEGRSQSLVADGRGGLTWTGTIPSGAVQRLRFWARPQPGLRGTVTLEALVRPVGADPIRLQARTLIPYRLIFPTIRRTASQGIVGW